MARRSAAAPASVRHHYEVELELADRLRRATAEERRTLYGAVYDELYRRVPDHPQLVRKVSPAEARAAVDVQLRLLGPWLRPDATVLELGPGDCALSIALAARVRHVHAVDVSNEITRSTSLPANLQLVLSDGTSVPVPEASVDVAYSNQLMEHLHPDDALAQLRNVFRALKPGGVYVCVTPSRLSGPHDVSLWFDDVAKGFHLKEYTVGELVALFEGVGFRDVRALVGARGRMVPVPARAVAKAEAALQALPRPVRRRLARGPARAFLGARIVATKP